MLQANKHISLVCREPGPLSTFNIILLSERGCHCLLSITPLFDQTMLVKHESVSRPQISVFGVRSRPRVSVCWVQAVASSVYSTHHTQACLITMSRGLMSPVIFTILSNTCNESCHPLPPGVPDP